MSVWTAVFVIPSNLIIPVVGWVSTRLLRRVSDQIEAARTAAVAQASALGTAQEHGTGRSASIRSFLIHLDMSKIGPGAPPP